VWLLLSRRIRRWLLIALAVPAIRAVVHRLATRSRKRMPDARRTRALQHADASLRKIARQRR
jgi:hypothetical protein